MKDNATLMFTRSIQTLLAEGVRVCLRDPSMALFIQRMIVRQKRAERVRAHWAQQGVRVPPFMIASVTHRCNLQCKGCYARAQHREAEPEMTAATLRRVLREATDLGVSVVLLAGGEPLTRPELLDITGEYPDILFPLFTNGLLLDDLTVERLARQRHVVPVLSVEGHQIETDARRGVGVWSHVRQAMARLRARDLFFGTSLTLTSANYHVATSPELVSDLVDTGCRIVFYIDYVPFQPGTEALELTDDQLAREADDIVGLRKRFNALFVAFPGDEEMYGGCLAAGRGFVHISPEGRLEPCPFAPYSDVSLQHMSLREALDSPFLRSIRESDHHLQETNGGCALWENRAWVQSLLAEREAVPA